VLPAHRDLRHDYPRIIVLSAYRLLMRQPGKNQRDQDF